MQILRTFTTTARGPYAPGEILLRTNPNDVTGCWFVTHFHNLQSDSYSHGHYFEDLDEANEDFEKRVLDWITCTVFQEKITETILESIRNG